MSVLFFLGMLSTFAYTVTVHDQQVRADRVLQEAWASKYHCKPDGYAGADKERTYRCDDGITYVIRDMPTHD